MFNIPQSFLNGFNATRSSIGAIIASHSQDIHLAIGHYLKSVKVGFGDGIFGNGRGTDTNRMPRDNRCVGGVFGVRRVGNIVHSLCVFPCIINLGAESLCVGSLGSFAFQLCAMLAFALFKYPDAIYFGKHSTEYLAQCTTNIHGIALPVNL